MLSNSKVVIGFRVIEIITCFHIILNTWLTHNVTIFKFIEGILK